MSGIDDLNRMLASLDKLGKLDERAAGSVADAVETFTRRTIANGTDPEGVPWIPRKADGSRPLERADKTLLVTPVGNHVYIAITGEDARHHHGAAKGKTVRPIILHSNVLPKELITDIQQALKKTFTEVFE